MISIIKAPFYKLVLFFEKYLFFYYNTRICVKRIGLDKRLQQIRTGLTKHNDLCYRLFRQRRLAGVLPGAFLFEKGWKKFILIKNKIEVYTLNQERSSEMEGDGIMNNKNKSLADKIPKRVWLLISFTVAMLFWYILSIIPSTSRAFQNVCLLYTSPSPRD